MSFNVNKICRVCLEEGAPHAFTSLFTGEFGLSPSTMLTHCAKVQIETNDGMPSNICSNCIYRLGVAYHFRQQCESSDIKLRQYLGLDFKSSFNFKDATTNTEIDTPPIIFNNEKQEEKKNLPVKKRIRKPVSHRRKPEDDKLKRGPKPKPKQSPSCFSCGRSFKCPAQLEMHIRTHTGERPFVCTYCPRRFAQNYNLSIHLRTHTGEKPFQCEVCSKQFSALGNLQSHQKIHTGVRDHVCPVCNKAFITPGDLSRHMATHTGIKNHHCDLCGKGFYRNRDLVSHKNKVHNVARPAPIVPQPVAPPPTIHSIDHETQENPANRRPTMPLLLAAPAARRPLQGFRDEALPSHPPLLITHVQMNY